MPVETKNTKEKYYSPSLSVLITGKLKKYILHLKMYEEYKMITDTCARVVFEGRFQTFEINACIFN